MCHIFSCYLSSLLEIDVLKEDFVLILPVPGHCLHITSVVHHMHSTAHHEIDPAHLHMHNT